MDEATKIINYEKNQFNKTTKLFHELLELIRNNINLDNIDLLNILNREFFNFNETLKEIILLLKNKNQNNIQTKIDNFNKINKAIKDMIPYLIKETI